MFEQFFSPSLANSHIVQISPSPFGVLAFSVWASLFYRAARATHRFLSNAAPLAVPISSPKTLLLFYFLFQETDILAPHIHLSLNKCFDYIQVRAQQKLLGLNWRIRYQFQTICSNIVWNHSFTHPYRFDYFTCFINLYLFNHLFNLFNHWFKWKDYMKMFSAGSYRHSDMEPEFLLDYLLRSFMGLHDPLYSLQDASGNSIIQQFFTIEHDIFFKTLFK